MLVSVKLVPIVGSPMPTWAARKNDRQRGGEGGEEERPDEQVADADTPAGGRDLVEPDRPRGEAAGRAIQPDVGGDGRHDDRR